MLARNIHDEDTIELQLSPAELEGLTRAAEAAEAVEREPAVTAPAAAARVPAAPAPAIAAANALELRPAPAPEISREATPAMPTVRAPIAAPANTPAHVPAAPTGTSTIWPLAAPAPAAPAAPSAPAIPAVPPALVAPSAPALAASPTPLKPLAPITIERAQTAIPAEAPLPVAASPRNSREFLSLQIAAAFTAAVAALVALFYYWPAPRSAEPVTAPAAPPATITAPAHEAAPQPASEPPATELTGTEPRPVRFANPFDSSEIFEFPAGTPYGEARDEVARTLRARALERNGVLPPTRKTTATAGAESPETEASLARQL